MMYKCVNEPNMELVGRAVKEYLRRIVNEGYDIEKLRASEEELEKLPKLD